MANITTKFVEQEQSMPTLELASKNAILIYGVAPFGELRVPIDVTPSDVFKKFGYVPNFNSPNYWRSAVRAYEELIKQLNNMTPLNEYHIKIVRIGNAQRAYNYFYEREQLKYQIVRIDDVISIENDPPTSANDGDRYIVGTSPTGVFTGNANKIAVYNESNGLWSFINPLIGYTTNVTSMSSVLTFDGTSWIPYAVAINSWRIEPNISLKITSKEYSDSANFISVQINPDTNNQPFSLSIKIPTGDLTNEEIVRTFYFNMYKNADELVSAINSDPVLEKYVTAETEYVKCTSTTIYQSNTPKIFSCRDINKIGANCKLKSVNEVVISNNNISFQSSGTSVSSVELPRTPYKDPEKVNKTLNNFVLTAINEEATSITTSEVGLNEKTVTLSYLVSGYYNGGNVNIITVTKNNTTIPSDSERQQTDTEWYQFDSSSGRITFYNENGFELGDVYYVTYNFVGNFDEAFERTALDTSKPNMYFVSYRNVIFTSVIPYKVSFTYSAYDIINANSYTINYNSSTITLMNNIQIDDGDKVIISATFIPDLPEISGKSLTINGNVVVQPGNLINGNSGMNMTETEYMREVALALRETIGIPCRYVIVAGAFIDNTYKGLNPNTGLFEDMLVDYVGLLSGYLEIKNINTSQCEGFLAAKPLVSSDPKEQMEYLRNIFDVTAKSTNAANAAVRANCKYLVLCASMGERNIINGNLVPLDPAVTILGARLNKPKNTSLKGYPINKVDSLLKINDETIFAAIANMRFTFATYDYDYNNTMVIYDAPTAALPNSQWRRQFINEIVFDVVNTLRTAAKPFLGKGVDLSLATTMKTNLALAIKDKYVPHLINDFALTVDFAGDRVTKKSKVKVYIYNKAENIGIDFEVGLEGNGGV